MWVSGLQRVLEFEDRLLREDDVCQCFDALRANCALDTRVLQIDSHVTEETSQVDEQRVLRLVIANCSLAFRYGLERLCDDSERVLQSCDNVGTLPHRPMRSDGAQRRACLDVAFAC